MPYDAIADARLILTDDLIRESLRKDKEARKARNEDGVDDDAAGEDAETED